MKSNFALILAGGIGSRAGSFLPKQFKEILGVPLFRWCIPSFLQFDPDCRVVVAVEPSYYDANFENDFKEIADPSLRYEWVKGGSTRIASVKAGLDYIASQSSTSDEVVVFIHDGARPLLDADIIRGGAKLVEKGKGVIPVVPLSDSIRMKTATGSRYADRSQFLSVQTPQMFLLDDIRRAYNLVESDGTITDDASVAENAGIEILTVDGSPYNMKVTHPMDFTIAECLLKALR